MKNGDRQHLNRTGAALSPELTAALMEGARQSEPSADGHADQLARVRLQYATEAEPTGSIPRPVTLTGAARSLVKALTGKKALLLADKLGERMAFERSGTRLYDALISKFDAYGTWTGGPSRQDLQEIRAEEHAHFTLVKQSIESLGADPTAVTPSANLQAVASKGLCAVLADPRTNLRDSLEAILVAELVDNDCWENLVDLSRALGHEDLAVAFSEALIQEREHLRRVRLWLGSSLSNDATGKLAEPFLARAEERDRRQVVASEALAQREEAGRKQPEGRASRPRRPTKPSRRRQPARSTSTARGQGKRSGGKRPARGGKRSARSSGKRAERSSGSRSR
jgi:rubrerythrin